jgi:hypothetical protein
MKKILLAGLVIGLAGGLAFAQTPDDFKIDLTGEGDGIIITGYTGAAEKVVIPAEIEGIPVRVIGGGAFRNLDITEIIIPDTVTTIAGPSAAWLHDGAFRSCAGLTSVTLSNSLTTIGDNAFYGCSGLTTITIPGSVTAIGREAFRGCDSLTAVLLSKDAEIYFGAGCFSNCRLDAKSQLALKKAGYRGSF